MSSSKKAPLQTPAVLGDLSMLKANAPISSPDSVTSETRSYVETKSVEPAVTEEKKPFEELIQTTPVVEKSVQKPKPTTEDIEKVAINLKIPKYKKDEWKVFFVSHGLTITDGIDAAVSYLEQQVENGSITLGAISINKN